MKSPYTLRLPEDLKGKIKSEAEKSGISINQYIVYTLTKDVAYKQAARVLKERIQRAPSRKEALKLLDAIVPAVRPLPEDEISGTGQ